MLRAVVVLVCMCLYTCLTFLNTLAFSGGILRSETASSVVLIVIDALRSDVLGCYRGDARSPSIDRLAEMGTRLSYAYSTSSYTGASCVTMFTGNYPTLYAEKGRPAKNEDTEFLKVPDSHVSLFEQLGGLGYEVSCYLENTIPEYSNSLQGVTRFLHRETLNAEELSKVQSKLNIQDYPLHPGFLATLGYLPEASDRQPFMLLIWILDPHAPYDPLDKSLDRLYAEKGGLRSEPSYYRKLKGIDLKARVLSFNQTELEFLRRLYLAEVEGVDYRVGLILKALQIAGVLENTYIILTSDHGDALGEHGWFCQGGPAFYDVVVHVPFIIAGPRIPKAKVSSTHISHVELVPTLAELLGVTLRQPRQGKSMLQGFYTDLPDEPIYVCQL